MIIKPFNNVWWGIFLVFFFIFSIETVVARKKSPSLGIPIFKINAVLLLIVFAVYKIFIFFDDSYNAVLIANNLPVPTIWTELPLHLCDIGIFLIVIGAFTQNRTVLGHCLLVNLPAAIIACISPLIGFSGYSILLPRVGGYYFTHWMIVFCSATLISFGIYYPKKEEVKKILAFGFLIFSAVFLFNLVVRFTGLNENVNYYYSFEPIENNALQYFWSLIPIPGLYMLPVIILGYVYCYLAVYLINYVKTRYSS